MSTALQCFGVFIQAVRIMLLPESEYVTGRILSAYARVPAYYAENWIFSLEFLIGDAIVAWRTWALWQGSPVVYFPIISWVAALAMLVAERAVYVTSGAFDTALTGSFNDLLTALVRASYALSAATNGVATALIAYKAWRYRQFIKQSFDRRSGPTAVEKIFSLLVESGLLYLCFWVCFVLDILRSLLDAYSSGYLGHEHFDDHIWSVTNICRSVEFHRGARCRLLSHCHRGLGGDATFGGRRRGNGINSSDAFSKWTGAIKGFSWERIEDPSG